MGMDELAKLSASEKKQMNLEIMNAGSKGEGFLYNGYQMGHAGDTEDEKLRFLHEVFEFFNGERIEFEHVTETELLGRWRPPKGQTKYCQSAVTGWR